MHTDDTSTHTQLNVSLPVAAAANETFKRAKAAGKADNDMCAVYAVAKKQ